MDAQITQATDWKRVAAARGAEVSRLTAELERLRTDLANAERKRDHHNEVANTALRAWEVMKAERAAFEATIERHEDLLSSIVLYIKWRYVTKQLTTEQKELFAAALEHEAIRVHGPDGDDPDPELACLPSYAPRWWREDTPSAPESPATAT